MPHEFLDDPRTDSSLIGEGRGFASQGVEVEDPAGAIAVRDAGGGQVDSEHLRPATTAGQGEDGLIIRQGRDEGFQIVRQVAGQGERGRIAVFRVAGRHGHAGSLPVERPGADAGDLREPEPGRHGEAVAGGPQRSRHPDVRLALLGHGDETMKLLQADRPAIMTAVLLDVEPLDAAEGMLAESMGCIAPLREPADCRCVVVTGRQGPARIAEGREGGLNPLGGQVGKTGRGRPLVEPGGGAGQLGGGGIRGLDLGHGCAPEDGNDAAGSTRRQNDVFLSPPLVPEVLREGVEVRGERPGLVVAVRFGLRVDDPLSPECDPVLQVPGDPLGYGPVGRPALLAAAAVLIHVQDRVLLRSARLEYTGHRFVLW
nr:hypothetical protein [Aquisphaera insulae]